MKFIFINFKLPPIFGSYRLLDKGARRYFLLLVGLMIGSALIELAAVASIYPFIELLSGQPHSAAQKYINHILAEIDMELNASLMGWFLLVLTLASQFFRSLVVYAKYDLAYKTEKKLSSNLIKGYLNLDYLKFKSRQQSHMSRNVLAESSLVVAEGILASLTLTSQLAILLFLSALLFLVDTSLTLSVLFVLSAAYLVLYGFLGLRISKKSAQRIDANAERFQFVEEALANYKEIRSLSAQDYFLQHFIKGAERYRQSTTFVKIVGELPRFIIEGIAVGGLLLYVLLNLNSDTTISSELPTLALFIYTGYKLLPALQQIYSSYVKINHCFPSVRELEAEFSSLTEPRRKVADYGATVLDGNILELNDVSFSYSGDHVVLSNLQLVVQRSEWWRVTGPSGRGKTTLVDLIAGNLKPCSGSISFCRAMTLSYVPQRCGILRASILKNIVLEEESEFDEQRFERAISTVGLDTVFPDLRENASKIMIGLGHRDLSGGQIQRIGIARALYSLGDLIILDESTSGLDREAETTFYTNLKINYPAVAVISISHSDENAHFFENELEL